MTNTLNTASRYTRLCVLLIILIPVFLSGEENPAPDKISISWKGIDGLTAETDGDTLIIDTHVMESDVIKRRKELDKDPAAPVWKKSPVTDEYACAGTISGVRVRSEPIPAAGTLFKLSFEMKGPEGPFVYAAGLAGKNKAGRITMKCGGKPGRWNRNEKLLRFTAGVTHIVIEVFCLKPLGEYRFRRFSVNRLETAEHKGKTGNMVINGNFELGRDAPLGWQRIDNLTTFWEKDAKGNHYIRIDTDVYKKEAFKRKAELDRNPNAPAWKKTVTRGEKYNTIGGTYGVSLYSKDIPVEQGALYRLRVRFKGSDGGLDFVPKVFVKGYARVRGRYRKLYQMYKACRATQGQWAWYERTFSPAAKTPSVEYIVVQLYAYWPPGEYCFDDVSIVKVEEENEEPAGK